MLNRYAKPKSKPAPAIIQGVHPLLASTQDDWLQAQKIRLLMSLR